MGPLHRAALTSRKAASSNLISNGRFQSSSGGVCAVRAQLLSRVWVFATLGTLARQAPLSMGFSRQEYWGGLPCPPLRDLPNPGMEPTSLMSPALAGGCFATSHLGSPAGEGSDKLRDTHTHRHTHTNAPKSFAIHLPLQTSSYAGSCSPLKKPSLFSPADLFLHQPSCRSPHLSSPAFLFIFYCCALAML